MSLEAGASRRMAWRPTLVWCVAGGLIFLYYWALLSDGRFLRVAPVRYDFIFNSMIEYLARGRFDVDPNAVLQEGFTRDGRTYAYFGILPALLRWPMLIFPRLRLIDVTALSCAVAVSIAAVAQLTAVSRVGRLLGDAPYRERVLVFAAAMVIFGGAQVQFSRPSVYQESIDWAFCFAAIFVLLAFLWCVDVAGRKAGQLVAMAVLAGLCLLTRVSTSIGLYAACAAIMLPDVIAARRRVVLPAVILLGFAATCGYVNFMRWGSPLTFQDYRYYDILAVNAPAYDVLLNYGYFNVRRILFGLGYFFVPVWAVIGSDGHFLFRSFQDRFYYTVELPPATFFASDLLLCVLGGLGVADLVRRRAAAFDSTAAGAIAVCLSIPGILMLMAIAITFRYRMEFYAPLIFLALFGLHGLPRRIAARPRRWTVVLGSMLAISIVSAHVLLFAYKISPWDDSAVIEQTGWTAAIHKYIHLKYPGLDRRFGQF